MSISLKEAVPSEIEGDVIGHDYRLGEDQYRRTIEAGIIPKTDDVELKGGFLSLKSGPTESNPAGHYRLSVNQYRAMADQDILTTDDRIELLEGWLIAKMTKKPAHTMSKRLTYDYLMPLLPPGWYLATEDPVTAFDSEPEPDLSIVRGSRRDHPEKAPGPQQVALLIEVADASLRRGSLSKKRLYARSGFIIDWLINLVDNRVEVYAEPTGPIGEPDDPRRQDFGPEDMIPIVIDGREVGRLAVRDLLP